MCDATDDRCPVEPELTILAACENIEALTYAAEALLGDMTRRSPKTAESIALPIIVLMIFEQQGQIRAALRQLRRETINA